MTYASFGSAFRLLLGVAWLLARAILARVADLVGPRGCSACDATLSRAAVFCADCARTVQYTSGRNLDRAPFVFGGAVRDALHRLKYEQRSDLAPPLGDLLRAHVAAHASFRAVSLVIPIPLHPTRVVERGFNQAALLARGVAEALGVPLDTSSVHRVVKTRAQAKLSRSERLANVRGSFVVDRPSRVQGRHVLLVDDVVTTGATFEACRDVLLAAGAASVCSVAVACAE